MRIVECCLRDEALVWGDTGKGALETHLFVFGVKAGMSVSVCGQLLNLSCVNFM